MSPEPPEPRQQRASQPEDSVAAGSNEEFEDRIQIMELHSDNPLVLYGNQIFSCEWADMIGTDMHFTRREVDTDGGNVDESSDNNHISNNSNNADPSFLKHGTNYSLIAANRIKIIGRKVNLISTTDQTQQRAVPSSTAANTETQQQQTQQQAEAGGLTGKTSQVRFLQELMDIKRAKGETDMLLSKKRGRRFDEKVTRWAQTEERLNTIHQLNRDALTGDHNAVKKLEELYDQIDHAADALGPAQPGSLLAPQASGDTSG